MEDLPKNKRLRFREQDDFALLREVVGQNPFYDPARWTQIQENLCLTTGRNFLLRTVKDHLDLLLRLWLEKNKNLKDKSGIEEEYTEKDQLLQEVFDLMQEYKIGSGKKKGKESINKGKASRDMWCSTLNKENIYFGDHKDTQPSDHQYCSLITLENVTNPASQNNKELEQNYSVNCSEIPEQYTSTVSISGHETGGTSQVSDHTTQKIISNGTPTSCKILGPTRARQRRLNVQRQGLNYLEEYDKQHFQLKKKDQELEERKIALEEKKMLLEEQKFNLQEFEKKKHFEILEQKMQMEMDDRKEIINIMQKQDKLINILLQKLEEK